MVWLYAGGVSLILPDVRFGTVSLDKGYSYTYMSNNIENCIKMCNCTMSCVIIKFSFPYRNADESSSRPVVAH